MPVRPEGVVAGFNLLVIRTHTRSRYNAMTTEIGVFVRSTLTANDYRLSVEGKRPLSGVYARHRRHGSYSSSSRV